MEEITIFSEDKFPLATRIYKCGSKRETGRDKVVIINSATGVDQRFYQKFATYLSENNFHVFTYDYRGIACSRPSTLKLFKADFTDWGRHDFHAIASYALDRFKGCDLYIVGHSVGGVITGMAPEASQAKKIINIAAQMSYYKDWTKPKQYKLYFLWHLFIPIITHLVGYFPGKTLSFIEDLPKGIVEQWHKRKKTPNMVKQLEKPDYQFYYDSIRCKILNIGFTDDPIGSKIAIQRMESIFFNASTDTIWIKPKEVNSKSIGHFGFFKKNHKDTLWKLCLEALNN